MAHYRFRRYFSLLNITSQLLSQGGKEILLKVVALAISMFSISCFKLPTTFCVEIERIMRNFWWEQKDGEHKIHWVGWDKLCSLKYRGGLVFKSLTGFNMALLTKQEWRIYKNENSLLHQVLKARYFLNSSFLESRLGSNPSFV